MAKFSIGGVVTISMYTEVEADSEQEARSIAADRGVVQITNQAIKGVYSQPRMQASEEFQASRPAVFDRSILQNDDCAGGEPCWFNQETGYREYCPKHEAIIADKAMEKTAYKLDPTKVLYFSLVPFEGEVSMENSEDGDYVTRENFEQLLELYNDLKEKTDGI